MSFNVIVMSPDENPIKWLNSDELEITETKSTTSIRSISLSAPISETDKEYRELFRMGNKIFIPDSETTDACLYIINQQYKINYWKENTIDVEAEEVIVELNNVEPWSFAGDPVNIVPRSNNENEKKSALNSIFGKYFNINTVDFTASPYLDLIKPYGIMSLMELLDFIESETGNKFTTEYKAIRKNGRQVIERLLNFQQKKNLGKDHLSILDLGYNSDKMEYEIDESDSYKAIAPVFTLDEDNSSTSSNTLTKEELRTIIENWQNLQVQKGEIIPKVAEKYTENVTEGETTTSVEKIRYIEYWEAPFSKNAGDLFVYDDSDTGIEYGQIHCRQDLDEKTIIPKIGTIKTTEQDKYALYNACAEELIDKRYPEVNLSVDAYTLKDYLSKDVQLNVWDKMKMKIPMHDILLLGRVKETKKDLHLPGKNKITLSNAKELGKISLKETYLEVQDLTIQADTNAEFKGKLFTRYTDELETVTVQPMVNTLVSVTLIYEGSSTTSNSTSTSSSTSSGEVSYGKCGVSSDKKTIMAIGKPSASGESKYGYKLYRSVFENKCPFCGNNTLVWGIWWNGSKTSGAYAKFDCTGQREGGSAEGHIFCTHCDADFSCIEGKDHTSPPRRQLTRVSGPVASSEAEALKLKNGQWGADTTTTISTRTGESIDSIMNEASNIAYASPSCSPACSNVDEGYECVRKNRRADCFGMSAYLYRRLNDNGHKTRIVVYSSSYAASGTHRTVQVFQNNTWVDPSYAGFDTRFKPMTVKKNMTVCKEAPATPTTNNTSSSGKGAYKTTYQKRTDENGEFSLALNLPSEYYKIQCAFGGDTEYEKANSTIKLTVVGPDGTVIQQTETTTNTNSQTSAGGTVCRKMEQATGVTINSAETLYEAFKKAKYEFYTGNLRNQATIISRIAAGKGGNCVDLNQVAYVCLKELNVNVRICNGTVYCSSGTWGHVWCEINTGGGWTIFDASAAPKGKAQGQYICGTRASKSQTNPAWLLSD